MENETQPAIQPSEPEVTQVVASPIPTVQSTGPSPVAQQTQSPPVAQPVKTESIARKLNRIMAYVLIISGVGFVLIAILAIWEVFGSGAGDIVWRSLGSLGAIGLGALIVSIASRLIDEHHK